VNATKPTTVAAVRALVITLVTAVAGALITLTPADLDGFGRWAPLLGVVLLAVGNGLLRWAEGWVFDRGQPPQAGLLGGAPAEPVYDWATEMAGEGEEG
jgi:hypothetical protein